MSESQANWDDVEASSRPFCGTCERAVQLLISINLSLCCTASFLAWGNDTLLSPVAGPCGENVIMSNSITGTHLKSEDLDDQIQKPLIYFGDWVAKAEFESLNEEVRRIEGSEAAWDAATPVLCLSVGQKLYFEKPIVIEQGVDFLLFSSCPEVSMDSMNAV